MLRDGDASRAQELATSALETFILSCTRYDITHARVTLSRAALASGHERLAVQQGALARSAVQVMGYGLLCVLYPEDVFDLAGRIDGALTAYACGDALGVPWENRPAANTASPGQIEQLPAREGWPRGATSDDTALTLLVAHHLADRDGDGDPAAFLADLAEQESNIRGLGPTTTAAIERFRRGDEATASPRRATNGAAMRALPIGWAMPHDQAERRRQVTIAMSRATHPDPAALVAACVMATCGSWALEAASPSMLLEAAAEEAREAAQAVGTDAPASSDADPGTSGNVGTTRQRHQPGPVRDGDRSAVVRDPDHVPAQRAGERGATRRRYRYRRCARRRSDGLQADRRASTCRTAVASAGRPARTGKRNSGHRRRAGDHPCDPVHMRPGRLVLPGHPP